MSLNGWEKSTTNSMLVGGTWKKASCILTTNDVKMKGKMVGTKISKCKEKIEGYFDCLLSILVGQFQLP